ncbi:MAG TPA: DUF4260 family protein [Trebonia sp.]
MTKPASPRTGQDAEPTLSPSVTGKPLWWLRLDGLALLVSVLTLFGSTRQSWWLVPAVILIPDVFMTGYLGGNRVGRRGIARHRQRGRLTPDIRAEILGAPRGQSLAWRSGG